MKTPLGMKNEKIAHLNFCLEKLKFLDRGNGEDCEQLYRDIYALISAMEELESIVACEYCYQKVSEGKLVLRLQRYNIELNI